MRLYYVIIVYVSISQCYVQASFEKDWLQQQQYQCVGEITNPFAASKHYYFCMRSAILQCITDKYSWRDSTSHKIIHSYFDYFCGFIKGVELTNKFQYWTIRVKHYSTRLNFLQFSLHHRKYQCIMEKLIIKTDSRSVQYCGTRLPWMEDYLDKIVTISFFTEFPNPSQMYFILQYHRIKYLEYYPVNYFYLSQYGGVIPVQFDGPERFSYHLLSHYKMQTVEVNMDSQCKSADLICYDGPGILSHKMYPKEKGKLQSTTYQMKCLLVSRNVSCVENVNINYSLKTFVFYKRHYMHSEMKFHIRFSTSPNMLLWSYFFAQTAKDSEDHSHSYQIHSFGPENVNSLLEGESCMYGGLFIYQIDDEAVNCMKCLFERYESLEDCNICQIETSEIKPCADCLRQKDTFTSFPRCQMCNEYLVEKNRIKEMFSHCTALDNNKIIYLKGSIYYFAFLIYYQGYSVGVSGYSMTGRTPSSKTIDCSLENNYTHKMNHSFSMLLNTSAAKFDFNIQPHHPSEIIYYKYSFQFTQPRSIFITFSSNSVVDSCAYCIVEQSSRGNFKSKHLNRHTDHSFAEQSEENVIPGIFKRLNSTREELLSPVSRITVHLQDCKQMTFINWALSVRNAFKVNHWTINKRRDKPLQAFVNTTLIHINILNHPYQLVYLQLCNSISHTCETFDKNWWIIIYIEKFDEAIWKMYHELSCEITDVFLEVITKNDSESIVYRWTELPVLYPTWLTGCHRCNLIYVSDYSVAQFCNSTQTPEIKLEFSKHIRHANTLPSSEQQKMENPFVFHKYR